MSIMNMGLFSRLEILALTDNVNPELLPAIVSRLGLEANISIEGNLWRVILTTKDDEWRIDSEFHGTITKRSERERELLSEAFLSAVCGLHSQLKKRIEKKNIEEQERLEKHCDVLKRKRLTV